MEYQPSTPIGKFCRNAPAALNFRATAYCRGNSLVPSPLTEAGNLLPVPSTDVRVKFTNQVVNENSRPLRKFPRRAEERIH